MDIEKGRIQYIGKKYDTAGNEIKDSFNKFGNEYSDYAYTGCGYTRFEWLLGWEPEEKVYLDDVIKMLEEINKSVVPADCDMPDNIVWKIASKYGIKRNRRKTTNNRLRRRGRGKD